ncbi:Protein MS5 [Arabidopsis suecica]|uniref:Protein MS5 n=1 Tax=Arabidopsis suecica TaxID=45249 RepID=A0A8T2BAJ1_ARASU|nr:Protein MS5 [Arabidopsis suecica]
MAYAVAILVGATSPFIWSKVISGTSLQLGHITHFTKTVHSAASGYNITLKAKDPQESSYQTFKAQVNEKKYGRLVLVCTSSGPPGEPKKCTTVNKVAKFMPELPPVNPFQDDTDRFRLLKKSEVLKNEWIRLYLQLAVATSNRNHLEEGVANLKILKVAMEIKPHLEEEEPFYKGLGAYDAVFYIRYKDPCKARAGDDVDRVAIVRRVVDVHLETFILVGRTQTLTPAASNGIAPMEAI